MAQPPSIQFCEKGPDKKQRSRSRSLIDVAASVPFFDFVKKQSVSGL
jgi:hypothetical protein